MNRFFSAVAARRCEAETKVSVLVGDLLAFDSVWVEAARPDGMFIADDLNIFDDRRDSASHLKGAAKGSCRDEEAAEYDRRGRQVLAITSR